MTDQPPTELPGITVVGTRAVPTPMGGGGGGGGGGSGPQQTEVTPENGDGGFGMTQEAADAENERQKECAAQQFATGLNTQPQRASKEFFSFTWVQNGQTLTHELRGGGGSVITAQDRNAARSEFGVSFSEVTGFNHNHPNNVWCGSSGLIGQKELYENQFPSTNDWAWATSVVENSGVPGATFTLYITDCENVTRGFPYANKEGFKSAVEAGLPPPSPIDPVCSEP